MPVQTSRRGDLHWPFQDSPASGEDGRGIPRWGIGLLVGGMAHIWQLRRLDPSLPEQPGAAGSIAVFLKFRKRFTLSLIAGEELEQ